MKKIIRPLVIISILISLTPSFAAPPRNRHLPERDLKFRNLTIENGLSHSKVNCIYQDNKGFLWFGTNEGLDKYDGYKFTVFQTDPETPGSISANLIRCIFEDSKGNFWIGTEAGGLNLFNRRLNTFTHFTQDSASEILLAAGDVNSIIEDSHGNLWLGTNRGLVLFDLEQKTASNFFPFPAQKEVRLLNEILVLYEDNKNTIWVGTLGSGLCQFDRTSKTFSFFKHENNNPNSISDNEIRSIYQDYEGNLWIGTTFGGLNLYDRQKNRFYHFWPGQDDPESTTIRAILDDGRGNLWVGNRSGLYNFDRKTRQFTRFARDPNNMYSLVQNSVQAIYKDAKGDLWIGTRGGISQLNMTNLPFVHYWEDQSNRRYLNKQSVYAVLEDDQGDLWFATEQGGLNFLDRDSGLFTYYSYSAANPHSINVNNCKALLEDVTGNLWVGTFHGGLNMLDRASNRFTHYLHDEKNPASIAIDNVRALAQDKNGNIWIGTYGAGLDRFDRKKQTFEHILTPWHDEGFYNVHCLLWDKNGKLWMGASECKVGCFDVEKREFVFYQLNDNIRDVDVVSILEDSRTGDLWFGTEGGGLYHFNQAEKTFKMFSRRDGLPSNTVYGILQDKAGNLWLSTTNGLCRFNPDTKIAKVFHKENGLQSDQFNYNACCKTRDGEMFFGGINGVTAFYPERIQENGYVPPVVFTDLRIMNRRVEINDTAQILTADIAETPEITLSYKHAVFSFEFAALNYAISEQNQYAYKMEGFDTDWNYIGARRLATYTNLDPGDYTFRVKAANNDGLWNDKGASIHITITPPFWKTLWFKILIIGLCLWTIKHFINFQQQKKNLLKAKALANLAQLKLLRNQMNPHFLFNALGSIRSLILISKERAWDMVSELSEFLRYSMLNFNKVEALLDDEINAVNNYINIEKVRYQDSLVMSFTIDDKARQCLVPAFLFQPLIENSIKYGMLTSAMPLQVNISIALQELENTLSIDVSNTGKIVPGQHHDQEKPEVHGTSLENIKQRLGIMFKDQFSFQLYEEEGWVHAKIRINFAVKKKKSDIAKEEEIA